MTIVAATDKSCDAPMINTPTPAHAGLDLGELTRLYLAYSETRAAYEARACDKTMWPHIRATDDLHRAARNAMPDILALAGQAETLRRERDEARASLVDLGDQVYVLTAQRDEALESERLATECFTEAFARADTLAREVEAKDARLAELEAELARRR